MNGTIEMKVGFRPGTDIDEACADLCIMAARLGCLVYGDFNGKTVMAAPGSRPEAIAEAWRNPKRKVASDMGGQG